MIKTLEDYKERKRDFYDGYSNYGSLHELNKDTDPAVLEEYEEEIERKREWESFKDDYMSNFDDGYSPDDFIGG